MKVLIIGAGGREHALAWKLSQSPKVSRLFVAPGNAGTALDGRITNIAFNGVDDIEHLVRWAKGEAIDLTVVGPEAALAAGVVDAFQAAGLRIFGPTQAAAKLESSKAFAKAFMQRHAIPTAAFATFDNAEAAHAYIQAQDAPIVVKADGLAAGKGVVVAMTTDEAHAAVDAILHDHITPHDSAAGSQTQARVVIESYLKGEEASFIVLCDGHNVLVLASTQDHKRLLDGDKGPNTGGMGAYSPAPVVTPQVHDKILRTVVLPAIQGMTEEGMPFSGFLYVGIMVDAAGEAKVLEFNCRMGDPETQPIMLRLESDLFDVLWAATKGQLNQHTLKWKPQSAVGVVLAADGYPQKVRKGDTINNHVSTIEDAVIFHAGTALAANSQQVISNGGRVLCATALGVDIRQAQQKAYTLAEQVQFAGKQYRKDIGYRALNR